MVSGMPIATIAAPYSVAGCAFVPPAGNGPCVTAQWVVGAVQVLSEGQPVVIMSGVSDLRPHRHAAGPSGQPDQGDRDMSPTFPYQFDGRGRTLQPASLADYVRQLVEQVLFTSPGERVNLPDFGSGLLQLPFALNSTEMAAATQFAVQGALQKWLSGLVKVFSVQASAQDAVLQVTVTYMPLNTDVTQVQTFVYGGPS